MIRLLGKHNRKWKIPMIILIIASLVALVGGFAAVDHLPAIRNFGAAAVLAILARVLQAHYHTRELLGNTEIDDV